MKTLTEVIPPGSFSMIMEKTPKNRDFSTFPNSDKLLFLRNADTAEPAQQTIKSFAPNTMDGVAS